MTAAIYRPDYVLDLRTCRIDAGTNDWRSDDLAQVMVAPAVTAAALALHHRAGRPPTIAYTCGSAHLRVISSHFRIAGRASSYVESDFEIAKVQQAFADLQAGALELLATRRPYHAGSAMTVGAVMLLRPTRLKEPFHGFLSRLVEPVTVLDLAGSTELHGTPAGWQVETIAVETPLVVGDPMLDRLVMLTGSQAQAWAEGDRGRLSLVAAAKNYKEAWVSISVEAWLAKELRSRARRSITPAEARAPP